MNLSVDQLGPLLLWPPFAIYAAVLAWALSGVDYQMLKRKQTLQHVFYAFSLALMLLWLLRAGVRPGMGLHLLGVAALTLVVGWRLALLGALFPVAGVVIAGQEPWQVAGVIAVLLVALPVAVTQAVWRLSDRILPHNAFVYIFACGFFGGALAAGLARTAVAGLMLLTGIYEPQAMLDDYVSYLPLVLFPEALINGGIISVLVAYKPEWVATFNTRRYFGGFGGI